MLILQEKLCHDPKLSGVEVANEPRRGRRPRSYLLCPMCLSIWGPLDHLNRKYCSRRCKAQAQRVAHRKVRRTITKARSAQSLLRYHVQAGNIVRPARCEECGASDRRIEGAHFNYDEPLRVRWLCRSCHVRWDRKFPKQATVVVESP